MFLRHSVIQSAVLILCFRFCFNILIRRKQSVIQIKGIKRTMTAGFLVVDVVLPAVQVNNDCSEFFGYFNLNCFGCKFIFDFHNVSFPLETALSGRGTKRACGHDGQHRQTEPTRRHGKARWVHRVQKILVGVFGSLCIPPPLMRISRL